MLLRGNKLVIWALVAVLYLVAFLVTKLVLHKTAWEIVGAFLATFVAPVPIFVLVASWLRKWETHRPPPKLLALCWSLAMALFVAGINSALFYFGAEFHVFDPSVGDFVFVVGMLTLSAALFMYFQILPLIIARAGTFQP